MSELSVKHTVCNLEVMYNPFSLEDKVILVTGASSGIGRAIAVECSKMGARVIITARSQERLNETLELMEQEKSHQVIVADLLKKEDLERIVSEIPSKLDGIVNCAGFASPKLFKYFTENDLESVMKVNFQVPVLLVQFLLNSKRINMAASVVFISSINGVYVSYMGSSLYAASKGAVNGIVKGMAIELASKGIRVNCVNPGMIHTNILDSGPVSHEELEQDAKKYPLKRYGNPEEVAYAVIYLLSDVTRWMTGSNIKIDGGYTLL